MDSDKCTKALVFHKIWQQIHRLLYLYVTIYIRQKRSSRKITQKNTFISIFVRCTKWAASLHTHVYNIYTITHTYNTVILLNNKLEFDIVWLPWQPIFLKILATKHSCIVLVNTYTHIYFLLCSIPSTSSYSIKLRDLMRSFIYSTEAKCLFCLYIYIPTITIPQYTVYEPGAETCATIGLLWTRLLAKKAFEKFCLFPSILS